VQPWFDLWRTAAIWTWGGPVAGPLGGDPKQLRSLWMTQTTRSLDHYMRSTAFLELMHESLAALTQAARLNLWFPFR
jgi:hypothetical protein